MTTSSIPITSEASVTTVEVLATPEQTSLAKPVPATSAQSTTFNEDEDDEDEDDMVFKDSEDEEARRGAAKVFRAPMKVDDNAIRGRRSVYLAGSTQRDNQKKTPKQKASVVPNWQREAVVQLKDMEIAIFNPRLKHWDEKWPQDRVTRRLAKQVSWELDCLDRADVIAVNFCADTMSATSLFDLGLYTGKSKEETDESKKKKIIVYCEAGYKRRGNVDIVCERAGVEMVDSFDDLIRRVREELEREKPASASAAKERPFKESAATGAPTSSGPSSTTVAAMGARTYTAPEKVTHLLGKSAFLAGSIEMGIAPMWQNDIIDALKDLPITLFNPRRKGWDVSWPQDKNFPQFFEQVTWELHWLEIADVIALNLCANTVSPISLLELGLHCKAKRVIVHCEEGYTCKGRVDIVCRREGIEMVDSFDDFVRRVKEETYGKQQGEVELREVPEDEKPKLTRE